MSRKGRRSKVEIEFIKSAIERLLNAENPMTVRQVFYRLVSLGVIDKTEAEYKTTVCRLLADMRRKGDIPYSWIADNTRWMRKPATYSNLEQAVQETAQFYRRRLWDDQEVYVEVWLEKDALSGVLYPITAQYDVPLMVTRGYPSLSFLHSAAEGILDEDKPTFLYYIGDHDPSGVHIPQKVEADLREMAPGAEIHFERIAVNIDQIEAWNLPTRPTKKTDTRSKTFKGASVEADAIPPADLRALVEEAITQHINKEALNATMVAERSEREIVRAWAEQLVARP
ncbi:MAG: hypothetical protein IID48_20275 [Proteobacteria bacterium]|nr:hypothetical protein [Pseudomonadota bacterium]